MNSLLATRALSNIRKGSFVNGFSQAIFGSRNSASAMHSSPSFTTRSWGSGGLLQRNLSCSPASRLVLSPHCQSSLGMSWLSQSKRSFSASGVYPNMRRRFPKQRRNRGEIKGSPDNHISFGKYGLQALEPAWITVKQITAGQLAIKRNMRGGKLFLRIFPHKPVAKKPAEVRMGRGKGDIAHWVASVKAGRILFEIDGVPESIARRAITVAASKMPIKTRFVKFSG